MYYRRFSFFLGIFFLLHTTLVKADRPKLDSNWTWLLYGEAYLGWDIASRSSNAPNFLVNHTELQQISLNSIIAKVGKEQGNFRFNIGAIAGSYAKRNYALEPSYLRNILEANIGFKISKNKNLWIDAGVFPSHIGLESLIAHDNITLSRSLAAELSPYFESGVKVTYQRDKHLLSLLLLTGWQRIALPSFSNSPAIGTQYQVQFDDVMFNWSSYLGDLTGELPFEYFFHDLYTTVTKGSFKLAAGADFGILRMTGIGGLKSNGSVFSMLQYQINAVHNLACRAEIYHDKDQIFVQQNLGKGLNSYGFSVNYGINLNTRWLAKMEYKWLSNKVLFLESNLNRYTPLMASIAYRWAN